MNARRYFRRSGTLMFVVAIIALVGVFFAPDTFGRVFAGLITLVAAGGGLYRYRKARNLSATAVVRETVQGRSVRAEVFEPEQR